MRMRLRGLFVALALGWCGHSAHGQGTMFTYQGRLNDNGLPANGSYDFRFRLATDPLGGNYVGSSVFTNGVPVSSGLLVVTLDFGGGVFTGTNLWLEVDVRTNGGSAYTPLNPLQPLSPAPYAILAGGASNLLGTLPAGQVTGALASGQLAGTYSGVVVFNNASDSFSGAFSGNGGGLTNLAAGQLSGTIADARLSSNVALRTGGNNFSGTQTITNGSVGVGTTAPATTLHVRNAGDTQISIESSDVDGHRWTAQSSSVTGSATKDGSFQIVDRTLNISRLLIGTNGNVGVGTTSPQAALHVAGSTVIQGLTTPPAASATNLLNLGSGVTADGFRNGISFFESASATAMSFGYDGTGDALHNSLRIYHASGNPLFTFQANGDVGIGTTNPLTGLHLKNAGDTQISLESSDTGSHRWTFQSSSVIGDVARDGSFQIIDRTLGAARLLIGTNGNVGIRTATPATALDVNGTATVHDLVVSNEVRHPYAAGFSPDRIHPIAYGAVSSDGSVLAGTPNFSVTWDSGSSWYLITITGESYSFITYVTTVTPVGLSAVIPVTFSSSGRLAVTLLNSTGAHIQSDFAFVVFKPGS